MILNQKQKSFICSFMQLGINLLCVPDIVLGTGETVHTRQIRNLLFWSLQTRGQKKKAQAQAAFLGIQRKQAMGRNINQDSVGTLVRVVRENPSQLLLS